MTLQRLHLTNAMLLGIFILAHLANHLVALAGPHTHMGWMESARVVYRAFPVEILLLVLFASQIVLGFILAARRWRPDNAWSWAQIFSGGVLAFFLLQHLGAVLFMRLSSDLDTNFYWAASVVSADPIRWYFIPYYWLGVTSIFVHVAAALHFRRLGSAILHRILPIAGGLFAAFLVCAFSGGFYDIALPDAYQAYLSEMYGI